MVTWPSGNWKSRCDPGGPRPKCVEMTDLYTRYNSCDILTSGSHMVTWPLLMCSREFRVMYHVTLIKWYKNFWVAVRVRSHCLRTPSTLFALRPPSSESSVILHTNTLYLRLVSLDNGHGLVLVILLVIKYFSYNFFSYNRFSCIFLVIIF